MQQYGHTVEFLGPDGSDGYNRTYFYFYPLTIRNLSPGTIYLLGSSQLRNPEPLEVSDYAPPSGFEVYYASAPGEAVEARDGELIAIAFGPETQEGKIWLVLEGDEQLALITLSYRINSAFFETDPGACGRYLQIESYRRLLVGLVRCLATAGGAGLALIVALHVLRKRRKDSAGH